MPRRDRSAKPVVRVALRLYTEKDMLQFGTYMLAQGEDKALRVTRVALPSDINKCLGQ